MMIGNEKKDKQWWWYSKKMIARHFEICSPSSSSSRCDEIFFFKFEIHIHYLQHIRDEDSHWIFCWQQFNDSWTKKFHHNHLDNLKRIEEFFRIKNQIFNTNFHLEQGFFSISYFFLLLFGVIFFCLFLFYLNVFFIINQFHNERKF